MRHKTARVPSTTDQDVQTFRCVIEDDQLPSKPIRKAVMVKGKR